MGKTRRTEMKLREINIEDAKSYKTIETASRAVSVAMKVAEAWQDESVRPKIIYSVNSKGRIVPVIINAGTWTLAFIELGFFVAAA
jgi:hypothetical protein